LLFPDKQEKANMKTELQKRLVAFAVGVILLSKHIPEDLAIKHLYGQLIRSATSAGLNYG